MEKENTIIGFIHSKDEGGQHRPEAVGEARIIDKVGDNDYIVELSDGTRCHALFNYFCNWWFIDDVYGVVGKAEAGR